jgi:WD40 repeat protein
MAPIPEAPLPTVSLRRVLLLTLLLALAGCRPKLVSPPPSRKAPPPQEVWVTAAAFSSDSRRLAVGFSAQNPLVKVWDLATDNELWSSVAHQGTVRAIAFEQNGKALYTGGADGLLKLWDAETGRVIREIPSGEQRVRQIVPVPGGKLLLTGHDTGRVKVWDSATRKVVRTLEAGPSAVSALAVSSDGRRALAAFNNREQYTILWDLENGTRARTLQDLGWGYAACFSPDGRYGLSPKQDGIAAHLVLWDLTDGREVRVFRGHLKEVFFLAFSPNGDRVFSAGYDYILRCWNAQTAKVLWKIQLHKATKVALSPDGRQIFTASGEDIVPWWSRSLELWDAATGERIRMLTTNAVTPVFKERSPFD